jgi:hypothetical protein
LVIGDGLAKAESRQKQEFFALLLKIRDKPRAADTATACLVQETGQS